MKMLGGGHQRLEKGEREGGRSWQRAAKLEKKVEERVTEGSKN